MNRVAVGDYKCEEGIILYRLKKRTYQLLYKGRILEEFAGESVDIAQKKMVAYIVDFDAEKILDLVYQ